jgi:hypothetical protein
MVAHAFNLNTQEAEAGRVSGQPRLHSEKILSQNKSTTSLTLLQNQTKPNQTKKKLKKLDIIYRPRSKVLNVHWLIFIKFYQHYFSHAKSLSLSLSLSLTHTHTHTHTHTYTHISSTSIYPICVLHTLLVHSKDSSLVL